MLRPRLLRLPLLLAVLTTGLAGATEDPSPAALRLVSYNIKHGRGMDEVVDLERIARVLRSLNPDLVALQEVDRHCTRSGNVDQADTLGRMLGMEHRFGKFMDFQGGEYGLAILSRLPIAEAIRHPLSPGAEPRCALEILVKPENRTTPLSFVSIHHDWTSEEFRVAQVTDLFKALAARTHPVLLAGDFNAPPGDRSLQLLADAGFTSIDKKGAKTFPSPAPTIEIDYFLTRGLTFPTPPLCTVHDERVASDHCPIVTVLPLPSPPE